ncbi:MAG: chromosomal replication initiator protein DnaA [Candidatus Peribacteraceae bacterium]|jgi:chromosomal replication initiator protein|nr:chromosomal replication initiator protein DnaA [Candidatus Peribacteraceae bacterium]
MTSSVSSSALAPQVTHTDFTSLWLAILEKLSPELQRTEFITWFRDTTILGREEGKVIIGLPLPMVMNWHLEKFQAVTLEKCKEVDSAITQVVYKVDGNLKDNRDRSIDILEHFPDQKRRKLPGKQEVKMAEGLVSKILNPRYLIENFIVGSNNRLAQAACAAVASSPGGKYNPLFLYGGVGLGKTHLLQATGNAILQRNPRATVVYATTEDFTNQVVEAIRTQKMENLRRRYRQVDILIIDDIQFLANKERTQEEFFHTFNTLYEAGKQIIISSDRPPDELKLEDRLVSRFERGMIADVSVPDYETRLAILVEKSKEYELFIDMSVLQFIAEHTTKNVRELEGILMQAVAQYELEQRMPTIKSIADIMSKLNKDPHVQEQEVGFESQDRKKATLQDVMEAVSKYYSVSLDDMMGTSRVREVLLPRQIAMYIGKQHLAISYVRLGEVFGNRDHTTVMNSCGKIEKKIQGDHNVLREVHTLTSELGLR